MLDPRDLHIRSYRDPAHGNCTWLPMNGITIVYIPTQIGVTVNSERSQYHNKEKALKLLEKLVLLEQTPEPYPVEQVVAPLGLTTSSRVAMIKEVRVITGCSLKEAKEAIDLYGTVDGAVAYIASQYL